MKASQNLIAHNVNIKSHVPMLIVQTSGSIIYGGVNNHDTLEYRHVYDYLVIISDLRVQGPKSK